MVSDDNTGGRRKSYPPLTPKEKQLVGRGIMLPRDIEWLVDEEREKVRLFTTARLEELEELTKTVKAYEAGTITPKEAEKKWDAYTARWDVPFTDDPKFETKLSRQAYVNAHGHGLDWEKLDRENAEFWAARSNRGREGRQHGKKDAPSR